MPSGYPAALDTLANPAGTTMMDDPAFLHSVLESNQGDAIQAIQSTLGINPQGGQASVVARLNAIDVAVAARQLASEKAAANGLATLDATSKLVQNLDASKMTSGLLDAARIPNLDAAKIATGLIPAARIGGLPASQTTSGTFAAARIPTLDGSIIATGTIDAARLPSSVTANANARAVADIAGRDAIPLIERVNGMLVVVRSPESLYEWDSGVSTWRTLHVTPTGGTTIPLATNFATQGGNYGTPVYYVDTATKRGYVEGVVKRINSNSANQTVHTFATLPAGAVPVREIMMTTWTDVGGEKAIRVNIATTGTMSAVFASSAVWNINNFLGFSGSFSLV